MRRSVMTMSKLSSVSALEAAWTPSACETRWPRLLRMRARVVRAEGSSSTTRMAAMVSTPVQGKPDHEPTAPTHDRVHVDPAAMRGDDPPSDAQPESRPTPLLRVEGLEHALAVLGRDPPAGLRHRHDDLAVVPAHVDAEPAAAV